MTSTSTVHLTRRGRAVVVGLSVVLLLAAFSLGRVGSQAATVPDRGTPLVSTTVEPGETLWAVAVRVAPRDDPREVVARLREVNRLSGSDLQAGQQLLVPAA